VNEKKVETTVWSFIVNKEKKMQLKYLSNHNNIFKSYLDYIKILFISNFLILHLSYLLQRDDMRTFREERRPRVSFVLKFSAVGNLVNPSP